MAILIFVSLIAASYPSKVNCNQNYLLTVEVKDSSGNSLVGAHVYVNVLYGEYGQDDYRTFKNYTNKNGIASFQLKSIEPLARVTVGFKGLPVAYKEIHLEAPKTSATIYCSVSDLKLLVVQANGKPIKNAKVTLSWKYGITNKTEMFTDANGSALFPQMPHYSYRLSVKWKSKTVYQDLLQFHGETEPFQVNCSVYDLTVKVFDKRQKPIPDAQLTLTREDNNQESKQTSNDGIAVFKQLAIGNYTLEVFYGSISSQTNLSLTNDREIVVVLNTTVLSKYYIKVDVKWTDGKYAKGVKVEIWNVNGEKVASGITDNSGKFIKQLLEGNYTVGISIYHYNEKRNVTLSHDVTINFEINTTYRTSTVIVKVFDKNGKPAGGAQVEILTESVVTASGTTNMDGITAFNLPGGVYQIRVTYEGETLEQTVRVTGNQTVSLSFQTNVKLQDILIGIGLLSLPILAISVIFYARKRRNKRKELIRTLKDLKSEFKTEEE